MSCGEPRPSWAFFAKPCQTSAARSIHAAVKGVGGVEEIGCEAVRAEGARERDGVVDAIGDRGVAAGAFVGVAADGEDLSARGGEARVGGFAHPLAAGGSRAGRNGSAGMMSFSIRPRVSSAARR